MSYLAVDDADARVPKAQAAGAMLIGPTFAPILQPQECST